MSDPGSAPTLDDVRAALDGWFDPRWAEPWDAVGLVCGDPDEPVRRIVLAVDAVAATVAEALEFGAQLLITHHPLLLTGVHGIPVDEPKGALVHRMIRGGVAHLVAHTNADVADPGVSDALAERLGLTDLRPLDAQDGEVLDKLVVFVPHADAEALIAALAAAGAGRLGDYDHCAWTTSGEGRFRPQPGAHPAIGLVGELERVPETRVEMVVPRPARADVVAALRTVHPYEEPAFDLLAQAPLPSRRGTGRIGELAATTSLAAFTRHVAAVLPATVWGVRAAGDPDRPVRTVAVCGGAGGSLADEARRRGADAYVTADLRHHPAVEGVTELGPGAMALIDAAHWATEAPWLDALAAALRTFFGTTVEVRVSQLVTDPWTVHAPSVRAR
ncbi:Nif3-like dinuclear metal center hexameric protein [uncultured Jatrophihabitans sp.]|uniref:Nif3-like dinuclear metal center hexameric protein n=1 Tax=uncultured Jatrophihabitans sp. TaxID=1610747 RepID=UPI0035CBA07D